MIFKPIAGVFDLFFWLQEINLTQFTYLDRLRKMRE